MSTFVEITRVSLIIVLLLLVKNPACEDLSSTTHEERHSVKNSVNATIEIAKSLFKNFGKILPTPQEILESAKQLLIGYPAEFMVDVFNEICTLALAENAIEPKYQVEYEGLEIQLITACEVAHFKLWEVEKLRDHRNFDVNKTLVIFSFGWKRNPNETENLSEIRKAFACRGDVNFLVLNAANYIDTLFVWSAFNTKEVGFHLSTFLMNMMEIDSNVKLHLIGHSLGAQIVGTAAYYYRQRSGGKKIPRVTGLDPSNRCFKEGTALSGIFRGDAEYLDIIHSNPGILGKRNAMGDVDFYPNGLSPLAPGCFDALCSHRRSLSYYIESIYPNNENNFQATRCDSMHDLRQGKCKGEKVTMGFRVPHGLRGNYFLEVNAQAPFGQYGSEAREKDNSKCGGTSNHQSLGNVLNATLDLADGVVSNVGDLLPNPKELFDMPIQLVAGLPFEIMSNGINELCSLALKAGAIKSKYQATNTTVALQFHTSCQKFYYTLGKIDQLKKNQSFKPNKKVIVLTTGWNTQPNSSSLVNEMSKAFMCRGDSNFMVYDAASSIDTLYSWSAFNTDGAGYYLAQFLVKLVKFVKVENIHLIGHSLGAHISSYAAIYFKLETGKDIPQVTGLDPAKPCFNEGEALAGLFRGDAKFVDVIHTNPGVLGKREAIGDVDLYVNGLAPLPAGCLDIVCAHGRATDMYIESIYPGNEQNFVATRCNALSKLQNARCAGKKQPMGYAIDKTIKGNYFLETNGRAPFGKGGSIEREKANKKCGLCDKSKKS